MTTSIIRVVDIRLMILTIAVLALSTFAAAAQHNQHHHHHHPLVAHHRAIPPDAFAEVAQPQSLQIIPEIIPLPRARPFAAMWNDRVTEVIGGRR